MTGRTEDYGRAPAQTGVPADGDAGVARLGFVLPSSNVEVEPLAQRMLGGRPGWSAHFARVHVETVTADEASDRQFSSGRLVAAARDLADAHVRVVAWAGTSGAWLGIDGDDELVSELRDSLGVAATTSALSVLDACAHLGARRIGLVTPYTEALVAAIGANLASRGLEVAHEAHLGITDSFACSRIGQAAIARMVRSVPADRVDAVVVLCTNMVLDAGIAALEAELGVAVVDSAAATVWRACVLGGGWAPIPGAGRLLASEGPEAGGGRP